MHKCRPLVKPIIIVSTSGYFISVLGPYFADSKNNDASILKHIMNNNIEEIKNWINPNDIFVVLGMLLNLWRTWHTSRNALLHEEVRQADGYGGCKHKSHGHKGIKNKNS